MNPLMVRGVIVDTTDKVVLPLQGFQEMRRLLLILGLLLSGCQACPTDVHRRVEEEVAAVVPLRAAPELERCAAEIPLLEGPLDLPTLWALALAHNPALREAGADVEIARGQLIQAKQYPNPRFIYSEDTFGNSQAPPGNLSLEVNQEIVTGGKRRLDVAIAAKGTDAAAMGLIGRRFEVLTRIRRAYYEYQGWLLTVRVNGEVIAAMQEGLVGVRRLVEVAKARPRSDLVRLQALLEEAKINQRRGRASLDAAWGQLAAEAGVPDLPMPEIGSDLPEAVPHWKKEEVIQRMLLANTELRQAAFEVERAWLDVDRVRAEVIPNVIIGAGYSHEFVDRVQGGIISVETALPIWDRKQGRIHEAQARWAKAQAAQRSTATRLSRGAAEAYGRYLGSRDQVEYLTKEVLPRLVENLQLVRKGYQAGGADFTFADVLLGQESLNDARLRLAEARRSLWIAIADLQGLMQIDLDEELCLGRESAAAGCLSEKSELLPPPRSVNPPEEE